MITLDFSIKIHYSIHDAVRSIPKVIRAHYDFTEEFNAFRVTIPWVRYSNNFKVRFEEIQWTSS
jgi:hypothetical protein